MGQWLIEDLLKGFISLSFVVNLLYKSSIASLTFVALDPLLLLSYITPFEGKAYTVVVINNTNIITPSNVAGNIAKGKSIFGITGSYTSDANAVAGNILSGKTITFY